MALTTTLEMRTVPGASFLQPADIALDNNYPTGGYLLAPAIFKLAVLRRFIECRPRDIASAAYTPILIITLNANGTSIATAYLALVVPSTGVQVASGTNVSAASFHIVAEGQ